ncbi:MAG: CotH kinase family protein [Kofleriaceae bacterium]|nr:CotH kinase family protein [Kofleriaceae bacterium]MBP6841056.1 CotH kinase family protein [Kofleriaceae bacterium]
MSTHALGVLAMVSVIGLGCGGDDAAGPDAGPAGGDAGLDAATADPSDALFPRDRVLEVNITLAAADWDVLRHQPEVIGLPEVTCASQPTERPYTNFPATVTIDGVTVSNVALRKKGGFGSLSVARPGLRIKTNEYVPGQKFAGLKVLTLNNNHQDDTLISQCLGYGLFAAAGLPASRCAFAHVTVNGEDLGVYSHVETIRDEFLERRYADATGNLYESGGDFAPGQTGGFQPKVNSDAPDCSDLQPVVTALGAPDDQLVTQLGAVVDLPEVTRYWAMEVITDHWDGYANNRNNFFFYHDPTTGKFQFIPWGIDALFTGRERTTRPDSVFACGSMAWRLYDAPATRAMYLAALRDLLDTVWDAPTILAEIDRMEALLTPLADPTGTGAWAELLAGPRAFVAGREAALRAELAGGDPVWPYPAGEASCLINLGTANATFTAPWDTLGQFGVGSGTMSGTVAGTSIATATVFGNAGLDGDGKPVMQLLGQLGDGTYAVIYVLGQNPAAFVVGAHPIDLVNVAAVMTFYDPVTDTAHGGGLILGGTLTLTSVSMTAGGPVSGSLTGTVYEL